MVHHAVSPAQSHADAMPTHLEAAQPQLDANLYLSLGQFLLNMHVAIVKLGQNKTQNDPFVSGAVVLGC